MPIKLRRWKNFWQEYVLQDWRYKLVALASALVIWAYVTGQQSMQAVVGAPIYFQNFPEGTVIASQEPAKIQVSVAGGRSRITGLKEGQIWVAVNLAGMHSGKNRYRLSKKDVIVPTGIQVNAFSPRQIDLFLRPAAPATPEKK